MFENLVEEMGDLLQEHCGFNELVWAYRASRPKSKEVVWDLEDVLKRLNDDELDDLREYSRDSIVLAKALLI